MNKPASGTAPQLSTPAKPPELQPARTLDSQALWDGAPIEPKTPPNPLHNDKPFLAHFPYLAEPW